MTIEELYRLFRSVWAWFGERRQYAAYVREHTPGWLRCDLSAPIRMHGELAELNAAIQRVDAEVERRIADFNSVFG